MVSFGMMSPKLIATMIIAAVMLLAIVVLISSELGRAVAAICTSPLAILKKINARYHCHHRGKADRRERHVRAARDRRENETDQKARSKCPGHGGPAKDRENCPTQGMGEHAGRHRPRQHCEWHREEDAVSGNGDPRCNHVLPKGDGSPGLINRLPHLRG
jgi:hypothetical protein